jgi:hypothetical protein
MDDLIEIIHRLSDQELMQLRKELKSDKQKIKLLEYLLQTDDIQNEEIIRVLNYQNNKSAYYTFKHRLLHDIIQFKFDSGKNKVIKLKEEINNLRTLLYSNQPRLLEKKMNDLSKRAKEANLYSGMREVYLGQYLMHFHDGSKKEHYKAKYMNSVRQDNLFSEMEILFYDVVFRSHTHFFNPNCEDYEELELILSRMKQIHDELKSNVSLFLYESTLITVNTNYRDKIQKDYIARARKLLIDYLNSTLQYHYPNCRFAILCLLCKMYSHFGMQKDFERTITELENDIDQIKGFRTYEDVYFFYLHSKTELFLEEGNYVGLGTFLDEQVMEIDMVSASNKNTFHLFYLKGVGNFYAGNFSKAYSYFLKARNYTKYLDGGERWVLIQNSMFALMVLSRESNYQLVDSEKKYLKRQLKKAGLSEEPVQLFFDCLNIKLRKKKQQKLDEIRDSFKEMQHKAPAFRLIDLDYFMRI